MNNNLSDSVPSALYFLPVITKPTRFFIGVLGIIEHIFINKFEIFTSRVVETDITDHCSNFLCFNISQINSNPSLKKKFNSSLFPTAT